MTADLEALAKLAWEADKRDIFPADWHDYVPIVAAILTGAHNRWADELAAGASGGDRIALGCGMKLVNNILWGD